MAKPEPNLNPPRRAPLAPEERAALRQFQAEQGTFGVAARLGVSPEVIRRALEGLELNPGTRAQIAGSYWMRTALRRVAAPATEQARG